METLEKRWYSNSISHSFSLDSLKILKIRFSSIYLSFIHPSNVTFSILQNYSSILWLALLKNPGHFSPPTYAITHIHPSRQLQKKCVIQHEGNNGWSLNKKIHEINSIILLILSSTQYTFFCLVCHAFRWFWCCLLVQQQAHVLSG